MSATAIIDQPTEVDGFDLSSCMNELRSNTSRELGRIVREERRVQARSKLREMAALRLLDERDALPEARDARTDPRQTKSDVATARALETRPAIAAAAYEGSLSLAQVKPLVELATADTDAEWAQRGRGIQPMDLERMARRRRQVTSTEVAARREARYVTTWRDDTQGMAAGRWWLPDLDGVLVEKVLDHMAERMRPAPGQPWDSLGHRKADALVELCRTYADVQPTGRFRMEIVNILDPNATSFGAEIEGIGLAQEQLNGIVGSAKVRDCEVDDTGLARTIKKPRSALPADVERHVRRRDTDCRTPGCGGPVDEIHHTEPVCEFGDTHDVHKLAGVCRTCHRGLVPHGPYWLIGDAEQPDGLTLVHRDDRPRDGPSP